MYGVGMQRLAAASGIGFAVFILLSAFVPGAAPAYDDLAPAVAGYYADKQTEVQLAQLFLGLAVVEALWFTGYLRGILNRADLDAGGMGRLTSVAWGGAIVGIAFAALSGVLQGAAAKLPQGTDPGVYRGLHQAGVEAVSYAEISLAVFLLATSLVILRTGVLPAWLGWFGFLPVILWTIGFLRVIAPEQDTGPIGGAGFVAFLGFVLWSAATSVALLTRVRADAVPAPSP